MLERGHSPGRGRGLTVNQAAVGTLSRNPWTRRMQPSPNSATSKPMTSGSEAPGADEVIVRIVFVSESIHVRGEHVLYRTDGRVDRLLAARLDHRVA